MVLNVICVIRVLLSQFIYFKDVSACDCVIKNWIILTHIFFYLNGYLFIEIEILESRNNSATDIYTVVRTKMSST